jgi:hypothetical protein
MDIKFESVPRLGRCSTYSNIVITDRSIGYVGQDRKDAAYVAIYLADDSNHSAVVKVFNGDDAKKSARSWLTGLFGPCRINQCDAAHMSPIALYNEAIRQADCVLQSS